VFTGPLDGRQPPVPRKSQPHAQSKSEADASAGVRRGKGSLVEALGGPADYHGAFA